MVSNRFSGREFHRRHAGNEIIEIVVDDRRALEAGRIVLQFERRGVVPLTVKMCSSVSRIKLILLMGR